MLSKNQHFISILFTLVISLIVFGLTANYIHQHKLQVELNRRSEWMASVEERLHDHESWVRELQKSENERTISAVD